MRRLHTVRLNFSPPRLHHLVKFTVITALCFGVSACGESDHPIPVDGVYDVQASLGENQLPARLELEMTDHGYRGRITVSLGFPFHVALRATDQDTSTVTFATSSPATSMEITVTGDSLTGTLRLGGNRDVQLLGALLADETFPLDLANQFAMTPWQSDAISAPERGEAFPTFDPGGTTLYFSSYQNDFGHQTMMTTRLEAGAWTQPEPLSFSGTHSDRSPALSPDGFRLLFASQRPIFPGDTAEVYNLWQATLSSNGSWGTPQVLSVSSPSADYQPSVTDTGIFFSSQREGGIGGQDIYFWDGNGPAQNLGPPINTDNDEMSVFVARDGSYMVLGSSAGHEGQVGNDDLYVSFFENGEWSEPANLGEPINSFANEYGAFVSGDGQYLYFTSDRHPPANIYRVEIGNILGR